jgi:putative ABC transport system ATP-binding protein
MNPIIDARELAKTYRSPGGVIQALAGVKLRIERGEFVAVMGPSGCGKSTLLHLLGGLDRPTAGELYLDGRRVDRLSESGWAKLRRREIGYVFQFYNLIGNLSVADNVELPALMAGVSAGEARKRRVELLGRLGLDGTDGAVPGRLSGGQQQRVALARALINSPRVLLADEPTGNLDSAAAAEVLDLVRSFHKAGQTVVLVTHDARVASTADRLVRLRDGQVLSETRLEDRDDARKTIADLVGLEA